MDAHPVVFEVERPERWSRVQLLVRLVIFVALGFVNAPLIWLFGVLYLTLPLIAALYISQRGTEGYLAGPGANVLRALRWWNACIAYLVLLTDRFPTSDEDLAPVRLEVTVAGAPSVGSALVRLVTSLPELLVVAILWWIGSIVWLIAAATVLICECVPDFAWRYQRFVVGLQARMLVYHASLAERYPPIAEPRIVSLP
jgi:hypothetical protein